MIKEYEKIIKYMGGKLEAHNVTPKSTQLAYYDWAFRDGAFKDIIGKIATFNVEKRMKFDEDWNLLMPVIQKLRTDVKKFSEAYAYLHTLQEKILMGDIKSVYNYVIHIIDIL